MNTVEDVMLAEIKRELADEVFDLCDFDACEKIKRNREFAARVRREGTQSAFDTQPLGEYLACNPSVVTAVGNEYEEDSEYKIKVLLHRPDIDKLMKFIAKAVMESDRCRFFPEDKAESYYIILQKAYAVLGHQMGTREWDLMPFAYLPLISTIIAIWCPGMSDFLMKIQHPSNCYYSLTDYLNAKDVEDNRQCL